MATLPDDWHDDAVDPGAVLSCKSRSRQHLVAWVHVHVVLLGAVIKILNPAGDRIVSFGDRDPIRDNIARMGYPLASNHKLIVGFIAKTVGHTTMKTG